MRMQRSILFLLVLLVAGCSQSVSADPSVTQETVPTVEVTRLVEVTRIVEIVREVTVIVTPTPQAVANLVLPPTNTSTPVQQPTEAPTPIPTPTLAPPTPSVPSAVVESGVNLRGGPGTNYPVVGSLSAGDSVEILARNEAGDWFQVNYQGGDAWVAAWLLTSAPAPETLSIAQNIPVAPTDTPIPPTPAPVANESPAEVATPVPAGSNFRALGEEVEGGGWRFNVKEVHKRKTVYLYNNSYVAQGYFLILIVDAVNLQSGTDYFARNIVPYVTEFPGNRVWRQSSKGTSYAQWQFNGISNTYTDVNPGVFSRMAMVYDLPPDTGRVLLSTEILEWYDLGVFSELPLEE